MRSCLVPVCVSIHVLSSYHRPVDAFSAASPAAFPRPSAPRRLLILPDTRADLTNPSLWHHHLKVIIGFVLIEDVDSRAACTESTRDDPAHVCMVQVYVLLQLLILRKLQQVAVAQCVGNSIFFRYL